MFFFADHFLGKDPKKVFQAGFTNERKDSVGVMMRRRTPAANSMDGSNKTEVELRAAEKEAHFG